jgi:hypothetical protein
MASWARRPGRKPYEHGWKSASKIGSSTALRAAWTTRSRTVAMPNRRRLPPGLGIITSRTASGWNLRALRSSRSSERTSELLEALEASGGRVLQCNWPVLRRKALGQVMARLPKGTTGDLHWHLVADSRARRRFSGPMEEFLSRSVPVELRGTAVATLSPTGQLVHLCLHAMLAGGHSLVWLKDIELSIANRPPDWDELVARALRYRLGLACALLLEASGRLLGAEVPAGLTRALSSQGGRPLLWWQSLRRRYLPGEGLWVRQKRTGQTLIGCTGLATTSTLGHYSLKLASEAWVQGRQRLWGTWVAKRAPFITITPPSLFDVAGDRTDRERYCQDVATWLAGGTGRRPPRHQGRGPTKA